MRGNYVYSPNASNEDRPLEGTLGYSKICPQIRNTNELASNMVLGEHRYYLQFPRATDHNSKARLLGAGMEKLPF